MLSKTADQGFAATVVTGSSTQSASARGYVSAKAVGSFVPKLTRKAFEKYGFSAATLLTDWARIVGVDVAGYTQPERLKWPKAVAAYGGVETGGEGRPGATLVLKVDPARAMDVEYRRAQLAERINGYFGYRAIAEIRILQAPVATAPQQARPRPTALAPSRPTGPDPVLGAIPDEALRQALAAMQAGIAARRAERE